MVVSWREPAAPQKATPACLDQNTLLSFTGIQRHADASRRPCPAPRAPGSFTLTGIQRHDDASRRPSATCTASSRMARPHHPFTLVTALAAGGLVETPAPRMPLPFGRSDGQATLKTGATALYVHAHHVRRFFSDGLAAPPLRRPTP